MWSEMWVLTGQGIVWTNSFFNTPPYSSKQSGSWDAFHHRESPKTVVDTDPLLLQQLYYPSLALLLFQTFLVGKRLTEREKKEQRMVILVPTEQAGFHCAMRTDIFCRVSKKEIASKKFLKATLHLKWSILSFYLLPVLPHSVAQVLVH